MNIRLAKFRVEGLFGEFDYEIPFNLDQHVTAIIAPNGIGKTLCLRMINSLFSQRWSFFSSVIFRRISFNFTNGSAIHIQSINGIQDQTENGSLNIDIKIESADSFTDTWRPKYGEARRNISVERYLPYVTRISGGRYRHDYTGEIYTFPQVFEMFIDEFPDEVKKSAFGTKPEWLDTIIQSIDCRLIEAQRLLILQDEQSEPPWRRNDAKSRSNLAIDKKAQAIKEIISAQISAYATLSQSLDRTFPRRVLSFKSNLPPDELQQQLADIDEKRISLMEAGILDTESEEPMVFPEGPIEDAISRVLSVYAEDNRRKLQSLHSILEKITLFKELIDARFATKDVNIDRNTGLSVRHNGRNIPLRQLSSGEQHQLVLFFELLFEIKQNSLILIDEPELSLHVAWQKKFIADLKRIIDLNKFDVVLATHSPQLIGRWNELVIDLGDVDDEQDDD